MFRDSRSRWLACDVSPAAPAAPAARAALWYGGVAVGVVAGAALSTYLWKNRLRTLDLQVTPLERAERLIESCESKLESIENAVAELKAAR